MTAPEESKAGLPRYLTASEVADLLRVKERKVYELAAAGKIPHRRVTGRLLFPQPAITAWIEGEVTTRPAVIAGSHDPLLDWAVRESGSSLASFLDGSMDGLARFMRGEAALCGMHVLESGGWNIETISSADPRNCVLIAWAMRSQGLILGENAAGRVSGIGDLAGWRVAVRQAGSGSRALFDQLADGIDLPNVSERVLRTETEAAAAVASGEVDAVIGLETAARQFRLEFLPLAREHFDLLVDRHSYFTEPLQALFAFTRQPVFRERAASLGGYDLDGAGSVRWISP